MEVEFDVEQVAGGPQEALRSQCLCDLVGSIHGEESRLLRNEGECFRFRPDRTGACRADLFDY